MATRFGLEYHLCVPKSKSSSSDKTSTFQTAVREELHKIVSSKAFRQVERLQRFLAYVVEECLAGRGDQLKEYPVGVDVFGKDSTFDPRMDPIVRVQARRLRMRLANYYEEEGQSDEIQIDLPKGGYSPTIRRADLLQQKRSTPLTLVSRNSVAVLPFVDDSPAGDERAFCHGVAQEIMQGLSKLPSLVVASTANSQSSDKRAVAMTITGSLRKAGNTLRVTTQISDDVRGCYVWTDTIDRKTGDPFALQEEIAQKVIDVLRTELLDASQGAGLKASHVDNVAAQTLYLQGRYHLSQRTERGLAKAIEFFTEAIKEDPRSAHAYAGLADAHNLSAHYGLSAPVDVWTKAASNASQAVLLDDTSSEAHASLAHVKATQDWDWAGAEQEFRRAIALDSRNAIAHHWYAVACLAPLGRLIEAMEQIRLAHAIDPISSIISRDIALLYYYYQRNYDLALDQCDRTIEQNPHFSPVYWTLGLVQDQRGDFEEAVAAFQRAIELSPPSPRILGALGGAYARHGKKEKAIGILGELQSLSLSRYISPFELALIHFNLGRKDEGFVLLTKAFEDRCVELISINLDPRFDVVRGDARFKTLIKRLNLPQI